MSEDPRPALERVRRESETLGGTPKPEGPPVENDAVEIWGRRIGRALSWIGVAGLSYWLGVQLHYW